MEYLIYSDWNSPHKFETLLLGGEFDNLHGKGTTPEAAVMSLKLALNARRRIASGMSGPQDNRKK